MNISESSIEEIFSSLQTGNNGLTADNASERLKASRKREKHESRRIRELKLLLRQFTNPLVLLLLIAVILSAALGENSDTLIILFILLSSSLLSFFQELGAGRAVEKLQLLIKLNSRVLRDGKTSDVPVDEIVEGDILLFTAGDIIPADCRILVCNELHVNESSLTGESFPADKEVGVYAANLPLSKKKNCLWKGTNVVSGTATAVAVSTGSNTIFGKIEKSLEKQPETAFEKGIRKFGYFILQVTIVLSVLILCVNLYFKKPLFDSILFSLAIAIGMAPELLPAIMTFTMSAGARRMMTKKVIVKKLSSIFSFGEVNVLCTDKTGTITEGKIKVLKVLNLAGEEDQQVSQWAYLNAGFQQGFKNPIDEAILQLKQSTTGYNKKDEIPYDFIRKRLSVLVEKDGTLTMVTKGAVDPIIAACSTCETPNGKTALTPEKISELQEKFRSYSEQGCRVIAVSRKVMTRASIKKEDEQEMTLMGFLLLADPLKESAAASLDKLKALGVDTKIITGDNQYIARYTAIQVGLSSPVILTGSQINDMSPEAFTQQVLLADVFAEAEPHQKERIIKTLQRAGKTVAYMGDGINDVSAIHAADVGISVNDAVDVAKEKADFVLLEKDLSVLTDGIVEGRRSFTNSMKYILINTGATFGNMFSVAGASLLLPFLPMLPKQILLTNFLTDFPYLAVASDNVDEEALRRPGEWNMKTLRNFMIVFGIHSSLFDFITFFSLYHYLGLKDTSFQTGWFLESVLTELFILFIIRTRKSFVKSKPGKTLLLTTALALLITVWLPFSPFKNLLGLGLAHTQEVNIILCILAAYILTADLLKIVFFRLNAIKK